MRAPGLTAPFLDHDLEFAKWLALLCMLANHIALALPSPWQEAGILIGRVSLPLFAVLIVLRLRIDTESRASRYLVRLLIWGLVAQPVYMLLLSNWPEWRLNALFTLGVGVALIYLAQVIGIGAAAFAAGLVVLGGVWLDGGFWMPLAQLASWYLLKQHPEKTWAAIAVVAILAALMNFNPAGIEAMYAVVALLAMPLSLMISPRISASVARMPGVVFYGFYPVHLAVIYSIFGPY